MINRGSGFFALFFTLTSLVGTTVLLGSPKGSSDKASKDVSSDDVSGAAFFACESYGLPQAIGKMYTAELKETSGLVVSLKNPGVIWAHNDSGDGPFVYAMKLNGEYLGMVKLEGAVAVDWEDMAAGPCGDDQCIYIGDIGDNRSRRTNYGVYRFVEPLIDPELPFGELTLTDWEYFPFRYPFGPRNSEALAVHPGGAVYIFTKDPAGSSEVYTFPEFTPDVLVVLTYLGNLDTGGVLAASTSADIHPSGTRLLMRTLVSCLEWRLTSTDSFEKIFVTPSISVPCHVELQGEAIAYDPANGGYFHVAEGRGAVIYRISCAQNQ